MRDRRVDVIDSWRETENGVVVVVETYYDRDTRTIHSVRRPITPVRAAEEVPF